MKSPMKPKRNWIFFQYAGICLVMAICAAALVNASQASGKTDKLWDNAISYLNENQWIPGEVVEHEKTFSLLGRMVEETRVLYLLKPAPKNKIELYVESAEENGKDVTTEARREINGNLTLQEVLEESPFISNDGQTLTSKFNGRYRTINDLTCAGFDFIYTTEDTKVKGVAWLETDKGLPVEIQTQVLSVPFTEDGIIIKSYEETEYYTLTSHGHSQLSKSQVDLEIEIPEMRFKGKVSSLSTCRNHLKLSMP